MKKITFIIPDFTSFVSGGNRYNQQLVAALESEGQLLEVKTVEEWRLSRASLGTGIFFVDSLYLEATQELVYPKKKDNRFILIVHHLQSLYPPEGYTAQAWMDKKELSALQQFDGFLTTSQYTADYLKKQRLRQPCFVLPPIVADKPTKIPARQSQPIQALMVANVVKRKGVLPFLKTLLLQDFQKPISINIAGELSLEKAYATNCQAIVQQNSSHPHAIHFLGALSTEELAKRYRTSNLFLSTSFFETYGMALQEAVVWGLPILALKGGNVAAHIQEGINGYAFDTLEALVFKLKELTTDSQQMEQLTQHAFANSKIEREMTWSEVARRLLEIDIESVS